MKKINEFFSRNIIIVIFVIAVLIGLLNYVLYPYLIESEYRMVKTAVAKETINQNTKITEDMIEYIDVPLSAVKGEVESNVVGKYVLEGSKIVKGGYFYKALIGDKDNLTKDKINILNENEVAITIPLNSISSTNDLIAKNQYIDLYLNAEIKRNDYYSKFFGMFAENIRVIETYNSNSIATSEGNKSYVVLAVDYETYGYIKRAEIIGDVLPAIKYDSYTDNHFENEYYSIDDTRYLIDSEVKVYKRNYD